MRPGLALLLGVIVLGGCKRDKEAELVRFNDGSSVLLVDVTTDDEALGEAIEVDLLSNTGSILVGVARVDPGAAPVGTDHQLIVEIDDNWQDVVTLTTVVAKADGRGSEEYELRQDSADHGVWVVTLTSLGDASETRTDEFAIRLWHPEDVITSSLPE